MNCENHPDREGLLAVSLPSIGIMRHMCAECRSAFDRSMVANVSTRQMARSGNRIWEMHGGRSSTDTESAYHNPNAVYERAQDQHTIDRSGEK
jgi:hypothetical protein